MLDFWQQEARRRGLKGIYFIAQKQYEFPNTNILRHFDAVFQFQPFESIFSKKTKQGSVVAYRKILKKGLPETFRMRLISLRESLFPKLTFYDYDEVWADVIKVRNEPGLTTFPGAFVDWDNTARFNNRAQVFKGSCSKKFEYWLGRLIDTMKERNLPEDYIFLNAWNEWAESAYLEPDEKNVYGYLNALKKAMSGSSRSETSA